MMSGLAEVLDDIDVLVDTLGSKAARHHGLFLMFEAILPAEPLKMIWIVDSGKVAHEESYKGPSVDGGGEFERIPPMMFLRGPIPDKWTVVSDMLAEP